LWTNGKRRVMENQLKLLMSEEELHSWKSLAIHLKKLTDQTLIPSKDTFSAEVRRNINYVRRLDGLIIELGKVISEINKLMGVVNESQNSGKAS